MDELSLELECTEFSGILLSPICVVISFSASTCSVISINSWFLIGLFESGVVVFLIFYFFEDLESEPSLAVL